MAEPGFNPVLVIFGVITWLLPAIIVVAPATLTVGLAPSLHMETRTEVVPQVNWTRMPWDYSMGRHSSVTLTLWRCRLESLPHGGRPQVGNIRSKYYGSASFNNGIANMTLLPLLENLYDVPDTSDPTRKYGTSSSPTVRLLPRGMAVLTIAVKKEEREERLHTVSAIGNYQINATGSLEAYNFPTMNYQAVMHAVGQLVMGWLNGESAGGDGVTGNSRISDTSLVYTRQFDDFRGGYEFVNTTETASNRSLAMQWRIP
ncbi:hypothetical protein AB5N19_13717 [Seiridium cardinale]|uniref:Uncharacterized protein n=1 Tax=Seiridium cardinale TaxID=138064 RepID=A0ABR2XKA5_9PEZI